MSNLPSPVINSATLPSAAVAKDKVGRRLHLLAALSIVLLGVNSASAATIVFNVPNGNYATAANWSTGTVPDSADSAIINVGRTANLSSVVPSIVNLTVANSNTAPAGGTLNISDGASLTTTGQFRVSAGGNGNGSVFQTGGAINASSTAASSFDIGNGTAGGTALYKISGGTLNVNSTSAGTAIIGSTAGSGTFWVEGNSAAINFKNNLTVGATGKIQFTLGSTGVSQIAVGNVFSLNSTSSMLIIDAAAYTAGVGSLTLISSASRTGTFDLSKISITGLSSDYSGAIAYSNGNVLLNVTAVPEPSAVALFAVGLGLIAWRSRRRRALA